VSLPIQHRLVALENAAAKNKCAEVVFAHAGETGDQALARLGLTDDGSRLLIVVVPMAPKPRADPK
jgi:hypothetical protein